MSAEPDFSPSTNPIASIVAVARVFPSATNPRKRFDEAAHRELTASVVKHGVLQPILVRPWPLGRKPPKGAPDVEIYELVAGERRARAAKAAGLEHIPALVRPGLSDAETLEIQVVENLQRTDLHPLEEAEGFRQLMAAGYDLNRLAERIGRSVKFIYDREKLLALTKEAQALFANGTITTGHAILLSRLSPADQKRAMDELDGGLFTNEQFLDFDNDQTGGLKLTTVREFQSWINGHVKLDTADKDLPELFPEVATAVVRAQDAEEKVLHITEESHIPLPPTAKGEQKILGPHLWKRADKACASMATGVIVIGAGRGEAFKVCTDKKGCAIHWSQEQKAAREVAAAGRTSTGEDRHALEQQKRREQEQKAQADRKQWEKSVPEIRKALAAALIKAPATSTGPLGDFLLKRVTQYGDKGALLPRGKSAEDLVRHLAGILLSRDAGQSWYVDEFRKAAKAIGLDLAKVLEPATPKKPKAGARTEAPHPAHQVRIEGRGKKRGGR